MKPYEEIAFPNGYLRWIREGDEYVCRMSDGYMRKMKALHEALAFIPDQQRTWVGLTDEEIDYYIVHRFGVATKKNLVELIRLCEIKLKEKNT